MSEKKKNIKITAIFLLVLGAGLIIFAVLLMFQHNSNDDVKQPSPTYDSLLELAKEMYDDGSYLELPKDENKGVYYMTLGEYKKKGYNINIVDTSCPDDFKILYFEIEDIDDFNPIYTVSSCTTGENSSSVSTNIDDLIKLANELYENNEYLNFIKSDGGYYMSIGMYKDKGYDTSLINSTCPDDSGILFFDIDHKEKYEGNPVFVIYECN